VASVIPFVLNLYLIQILFFTIRILILQPSLDVMLLHHAFQMCYHKYYTPTQSQQIGHHKPLLDTKVVLTFSPFDTNIRFKRFHVLRMGATTIIDDLDPLPISLRLVLTIQ
jgi:hypothetical protein